MNNRLELHEILKTIVGSSHVYFQPPESLMMVYPCIVYSLADVSINYADNIPYKNMRSYEITAITKDPDNDYIEQMLATFKYCRYNRRFVNDNLYHDVFTLYF